MRRALVIFLILLFPLNVFALSMSVAQLHLDPAAQRVATQAGLADIDLDDALDCETSCDIDPDEPPSGAELHYIVGRHGAPLDAGRPARAVPLHDAAPRCRSIPPPVKPPRAA